MGRIEWNRRELLKHATIAPALWPPPAAAQRDISYAGEYPDMLVSYLAGKTNALAAKWDEARARIRTAEDVETRNRFVREKARQMMHGLPERTPLDPMVTRVLERDDYRIENVRFQSRPNFWVTGNLYVPVGKGPFPAVISPCGHSAEARIYRPYQFMYQGLVKCGFVVLAYDPIGQGERRQFWNPLTRVNEIGGPVTWEHSLPGQVLLLIGQDLTNYRVWDGMRAIDYLLTRSEVDEQRIGCAGQSGGGTLTLFISALDERVKCAAVHEGGTRHRWPLRMKPETPLGTGDTEQHFFPAGIYGVDLCDLHAAIAPRPLLATIEHESPDFMLTVRHVAERYTQMGAADKFETEFAGDPHGMTMKLRLRNTDWFCRWFQNRRGPEREPDFRAEPAEDLHVTPLGSIRYSQQGDTIYSVLWKKAATLPPSGPAKTADIARLLRYKKPHGDLGARRLETTVRKGYRIEKLEFLSEPGIYIPTWVFLPEGARAKAPAILYVHERGKEADGLELGPLETVVKKGRTVVSIDVRGIGATRPAHPADESVGFRHVDDAETVMVYWAWEMDESLLGMRVQDVVRSVDYVLSRPDIDPDRVDLVGRGTGALWVLFAAAFDKRVHAAVCEGGLLSYRVLTDSDRYLHGANVFIPDVLKHFDLPEVAAAVGCPLTVVSPLDAMKNQVEVARARRSYQPPVRVVGRSPGTDWAEQCLKLLEA
jgi:cephalosporin-C deacetylase-like acetyl esterase